MRHRSAHSHQNPWVRLAVALGIIFLCLFGLYFLVASLFMPKDRTTVLLLTDPVHVASYDPIQGQWSIISFPTSTHITGIQGLGEYAIDSLWNIAATEGSPSGVVLGSLTDELGIPIDYFLGKKGNRWEKANSGLTDASHYFGLLSIIKDMFHQYETNIPFPLFVSLTRAFRTADFSSFRDINLVKNSGLTEEQLPDFSSILVFNRDQFDYITDNIFEDRSIRRERLRIAVFNTTGRPFLGSRVARILTKSGGNVIQVGNDEPVNECQIVGQKDNLETRTAHEIEILFACKPTVSQDENRADLIVKIGKVYEQRFLPKE